MSISCPSSLLVSGWTVPHIRGHRGPPSGPKNEPKYAQTKKICLYPCSNSIVRDHLTLKSLRKCLYHVRLPCWCLGGPYHTFGTIGAPVRTKKMCKWVKTQLPSLGSNNHNFKTNHSDPKSCDWSQIAAFEKFFSMVIIFLIFWCFLAKLSGTQVINT